MCTSACAHSCCAGAVRPSGSTEHRGHPKRRPGWHPGLRFGPNPRPFCPPVCKGRPNAGCMGQKNVSQWHLTPDVKGCRKPTTVWRKPTVGMHADSRLTLDGGRSAHPLAKRQPNRYFYCKMTQERLQTRFGAKMGSCCPRDPVLSTFG